MMGPSRRGAGGLVASRRRRAITFRRQRGRTLLIVTLILAMVSIVAGMEAVRRNGLYWFDVTQDYRYGFDPEAAKPTPVAIGDNGFQWPRTEIGWDTAVLEIDLASRLSGYWFEPCIELGPAESPSAQCFERGLEGRRHLVLHPTDVDPSGFVSLRARHIRWRTGEGALRLFRTPSERLEPVLVLAPHPDDAEIAAFGLYATTSSYVATMTAGNYVDGLYSGLALDEAAQDDLRGDVRTWDSLAVPLWGGVPSSRTVNLGYPTFSLGMFHGAAGNQAAREPVARVDRFRRGATAELLDGRSAHSDWASVVQDLVTLVRNVRPAVIVTPHPMLDAHPDHQYTTIALLEALEILGDTSAVLFLYTNHHPASESYPFGPSEARISLPPVFDADMPIPKVLSFQLDGALQIRKLFALDAMHDLRAPPQRLSGGPATVLLTRVRQGWELILRDPFGDYSYFRRAVRPNELFLVYAPDDRRALAVYLARSFPGER